MVVLCLFGRSLLLKQVEVIKMFKYLLILWVIFLCLITPLTGFCEITAEWVNGESVLIYNETSGLDSTWNAGESFLLDLYEAPQVGSLIVNGVQNPSKVNSIDFSSISKISGVDK